MFAFVCFHGFSQLTLAQRYASRLQRITLAQRIDDLIEERANAAEDDVDDDDDVQYVGGTQTLVTLHGEPALQLT